MVPARGVFCLLFLAVGAVQHFAAAAIPIHGDIKVLPQYATADDDSVEASLGETDIRATALTVRLTGVYTRQEFELTAHYLLTGIHGNAVKLQNKLQMLFPDLSSDQQQTQWLRLDQTLTSNDNTSLTHVLDRLSVSHSSEHLVVKLGRQALSWGNGLVFRPMDLFDPFAPNAIDTSYKPGIDMVYGQWLFDSGSDLAGLVVPRRDPGTNHVETKQSSAAMKWHMFAQTVQSDFMLARDYDDTVAALAVSGPWEDALWRFEWVPTFLKQGGEKHSVVINFEDAWTWGGKNFSGYVEYFRNGFGMSGKDYTLQDLPPDLIKRLGRGQVFNTGRDYLAGGLRIDWTPLLQVNPLLIYNANDHSILLFAYGSYSVSQNLSFDFGVNAGFGPKGTEFGGIETADGSDEYYKPLTQVYGKLAYYF
jgi:hypothetical protein